MIFIAAALPCEAIPLIEGFQLKRDSGETRFRIYRNDRIRLIITGVGGSAAMIAVTYLLAVNHAQRTDWLINVGIAAVFGEEPAVSAGRIYQSRAIRNMALRRSFYPDILYRLPFAEAEILTVSAVYKGKPDNEELKKWPLPFIRADHPDGHSSDEIPRLVDMEAAYVYEAGIEFVFSHHIFILKIISDTGNTNSVNQTFVKKLVAGHMEVIAEFVEILSAEEPDADGGSLGNAEFESLASAASEALMLSYYQQMELRRIAFNYSIRNNDLAEIIGLAGIVHATDELGLKQIGSRREGRPVYESIRSRLLQP